jgi:hypothetical protein
LEKPLLFKGIYQMAIKSRVISEPILIIHFFLTKMNPAGSPATLIAEYLKPFLPGGSLMLKEVSFNLSTAHHVGQHQKRMEILVKELAG